VSLHHNCVRRLIQWRLLGEPGAALRLFWLYRSQPELYKQAAHWLSIGEYLLYQLFGERRVSLSAASWSGLLNRHANDWDAETLDRLGKLMPIRREMLSEVSDRPFEGLRNEWGARWPALNTAPWYPGIGDGVASNIGAGCTDRSHIALNVGTSGAIRVVVPGRPLQVPDGLFAYCVDDSRSLVGGALSNAGNLYAWLNRTLNLQRTGDDLVKQIERIAPDSHGLTLLPFLAGERAPGWNDRAQAVFMGMTFDTEPVEMVRAALEAVAYRFYQIARRLEPLRAEGAVYVASGAAILNSPPWMQIVADVLNAPVYANLEPEATIRGPMYLALGLNPAPQLGTVYTPDATRNAIYREAIRRQENLYKTLFL
jgi:gluconokinase